MIQRDSSMQWHVEPKPVFTLEQQTALAQQAVDSLMQAAEPQSVDTEIGPVALDYGPSFMQMMDEQGTVRWASPNQIFLRRNTTHLFSDALNEFSRQYVKFGDQYHTVADWLLISGEEFGEVMKAYLQQNYAQAAKEIVETIACLAQTYHELQRQMSGMRDGEYWPVNAEDAIVGRRAMR